MVAQVENLPFKTMHLEQDWKQNIREGEHPEIQQSVMWHLSKVVGKTHFAPPEMMKTFVSDPEAAKSMTSYVFDKEDLLKLRQDLIENPEKYEEMLTFERAPPADLRGTDPGEYRRHLKFREENRKYFHRVYNDGRCDLPEQRHLRAEYYRYKYWADGIKNKALDTLRLTVNRLLLDFENDPTMGNSVVEFDQGENETRQSALKRLYTMLNEESPEQHPKKSEVTKERSASTLKSTFFDMVDEDPQLSKVFGSASEVQDNQLIRNFRQSMLNELFQLVEVVLIKNQINEVGSKQKAILSKLVNVANSNDRGAKIHLLDELLKDKLMKRALKEAIGFVKPFFFEVFQEKLEQEAQTVLKYHWLHDSYPEFKKNRVLQELLGYHDIRDSIKVHDKQLPEKSTRQGYRTVLQMMNVGSEWQEGKTLEEKEQLLAERTRAAVQMVSSFDEVVREREELIDKEILRKNAEDLKEPMTKEFLQKKKETGSLQKALAPRDILEFEQIQKRMQQFEGIV